ncbi:hypothetical protein [Anatilimnocola floriformis]|uniref:hypothetical protein n=1 Tax=Anatilimnocola floriformis TaxID=2948575 RepID=UPI0020C1CEC8|nr:hypothetical protein [Anatilimnocola floriformis]
MADPSIETLLTELRRRYADRLISYGTSPLEEDGTGFRLQGVPAVFSALTIDGTLPSGRFDVQIESYPPGDYVFNEEYEFDALLEAIADVVERGVWPDDAAD